ncbi:MAG: TrpB-like pyridoxal phosphate-dependent enzyme [Proteobacteria bacterium]|nr:TrpB-like pyridoxal phosphate-dependent enzyme [Pseudomonadota bacterium]MBU1586025.1 TrpB-like pyridoxal phosphate-dependent enzyme [Pseudomonadota bacterium]MBU2452523.1 TrpB-like pyridoxal phosphate-dependent enzyme [Pseudomonadota bacterium]MBU2627464.1 TrpB-like pyridoxal phosphate-dependent enzyme [Pseudomonadota bacterium]
MRTKKYVLSENDMPRQWYNIMADMPNGMEPPLHPGTGQPCGPQDLEPIFPMNLIEQEVSTQQFIDIPEEILDKYAIWRPSPLFRAYNLEKALGTPAKIFYKNEGVSPAGSHKPNTAIAQAYYNKVAGTKKITTETGAGQWGSSLAMCCSFFGIECKVFMVKISYNQKPYRRLMMETWGAKCTASPSNETAAGRSILERDPDCPGSLGMAISEAVEQAVADKDTKYALGSVLNHVMIHQSIIGLEAQKQMEMAGAYPDVIIGSAGGGSNFAGLAMPYARDVINGKKIDIIAVEPSSCPTLTRGPFAYDFGDTVQMTPLLPMHSLGHNFVPAPIHAGGLRYHGMAPIVSQLVLDGIIRAESIHQMETFKAGLTFARSEGYISAPECNHAVAMTIREALKAKEEGKEKTILFNWSGHGLVDLGAYENYFRGNLSDHELPQEQIDAALKDLESLPKPRQAKK